MFQEFPTNWVLCGRCRTLPAPHPVVVTLTRCQIDGARVLTIVRHMLGSPHFLLKPLSPSRGYVWFPVVCFFLLLVGEPCACNAARPPLRFISLRSSVYRVDESVVSLTGIRNGTGLICLLPNISTVSQGKHNEAIPLLERAYSIRRKRLGEKHPSTVETWISLEHVRNHAREEEARAP